MLKNLFSNRLFIGALAFFVLMVVGGTLYLRHIQRQDQIALERTQERLQQWQVRQKQPEKVPEGDTSQGRHIHADGTWHDGPHEAETPVETSIAPSAAPAAEKLTTAKAGEPDLSFLDDPEAAIRRHAEILLDPDRDFWKDITRFGKT
jgi:hypothetical protein